MFVWLPNLQLKLVSHRKLPKTCSGSIKITFKLSPQMHSNSGRANLTYLTWHPLEKFYNRIHSNIHGAVVSEPAAQPSSRVTGEGSSTKVTGDDWDRGEHVTGTEGASARRRNPSRPGPMGAMAPFERKRNVHEDWPVSPVTGSNGNTDKGSLITVSGGARG